MTQDVWSRDEVARIEFEDDGSFVQTYALMSNIPRSGVFPTTRAPLLCRPNL